MPVTALPSKDEDSRLLSKKMAFTDRKEFYSKTDWFRWAAVPMYGSPSGIILSALSLPLSVS